MRILTNPSRYMTSEMQRCKRKDKKKSDPWSPATALGDTIQMLTVCLTVLVFPQLESV